MKHSAFILISILLCLESRGATINAASAAKDAVSNAIGLAAPGDTVLLPANQAATWVGGGIGFTKNITLDLNNCTITRNFPNAGGPLIRATSASGACRVTRGRFIGGTNIGPPSTPNYYNGRYIIANTQPGGSIRIDHCTFDPSGSTSFETSHTGGQFLVDHCTFYASDPDEIIHNMGYSPSASGGWDVDVQEGIANTTWNAAYFEDNVFIWSGGSVIGANAAIQSYYGARTVVRHNEIHNALVDNHGDNTPHAGRWYEYYENDFYCDRDNSSRFQLRGGSGVVFNNRLHNQPGASGGRGIKLWTENAGDPAQCQVGRGKNAVPGNFSSQASNPLYMWNNTVINDGGGTTGWGIAFDTYPNGTPGAIRTPRDYLNSGSPGTPKPGYTAAPYPHTLQGGTPVPQAPTLSSVSPPAAAQGGSGFTLTVNGANFVSGAIVRWNGSNRTTTFVSGAQLTAAILTADLVTAGTAAVTVINPDTLVSNSIGFTVTSSTGDVTFYVEKGNPAAADDASHGTEAAPFASINFAKGQMASGSTLLVKNSRTTPYTEQVNITSPSGTLGNPCEIKAFPGDTPVVNNVPTNNFIFAFTGVQYWNIEGLDISGANHNILIRGGSSNIEVRGNTLHDTSNQICYVREASHDILFENNTLTGGGSQSNQNGEGFYIGNGAGGDLVHHVTIRGNTITGMREDGVELKPDTSNCIVENNIISNSVSDGVGNLFGKWSIAVAATTGALSTTQNHIIRNNRIFNHPGWSTGAAILAQGGGQYYNNVIYNVTTPAFAFEVNGGDSFTKYIWNNTADIPSARWLNTPSASTNTGNNIGPATSGSNMAFNPAFFADAITNDYHLVAGAAPIDAGANPPITIATDFDGTPRTGTFDVGAFSFAGVQTAPPTILPAEGPYFGTQSVSITGPSGASIFYTIDGSPPTTSSTPYTGTPFTVSTPTTVNAIAVKSGEQQSDAASSFFEVNTWVAETVWKTWAIPLQAATFDISFRVAIGPVVTDSVYSIGALPMDDFTDQACTVNFISGGTIRARNGAVFAGSMPYGVNTSYDIVMSVNLSTHKYSVTVTPVGGSTTTLATDFDFRVEQNAITNIGFFGILASAGNATVSNMGINVPAPPVNANVNCTDTTATTLRVGP